MIKRHVPAQALLVGHALDNDLAALKLHHRRLLDTSALYEHPKAGCPGSDGLPADAWLHAVPGAATWAELLSAAQTRAAASRTRLCRHAAPVQQRPSCAGPALPAQAQAADRALPRPQHPGRGARLCGGRARGHGPGAAQAQVCALCIRQLAAAAFTSSWVRSGARHSGGRPSRTLLHGCTPASSSSHACTSAQPPQAGPDSGSLCSKGPAFGLAHSRPPDGDRLFALLESRRAVVVDRHDMITRHVTGAPACRHACLPAGRMLLLSCACSLPHQPILTNPSLSCPLVLGAATTQRCAVQAAPVRCCAPQTKSAWRRPAARWPGLMLTSSGRSSGANLTHTGPERAGNLAVKTSSCSPAWQIVAAINLHCSRFIDHAVHPACRRCTRPCQQLLGHGLGSAQGCSCPGA